MITPSAAFELGRVGWMPSIRTGAGAGLSLVAAALAELGRRAVVRLTNTWLVAKGPAQK